MSKLSNIKTLTTAAIFAAIAILLGFFKIPISAILEIRFASIPIALAGALLGPIPGVVVGIIADVGGYLAKPTGPFFPLFTISNCIISLIFTFFLYKKKFSILSVALAQISVTLIVGICLNTLWLSILYGMPFFPSLLTRTPKEIITCIINIIIISLLLPRLQAIPSVYGEAA